MGKDTVLLSVTGGSSQGGGGGRLPIEVYSPKAPVA